MLEVEEDFGVGGVWCKRWGGVGGGEEFGVGGGEEPIGSCGATAHLL